MNGGLAPIGEYRETWIFQVLKSLAKKYEFSVNCSHRKTDPRASWILSLNGSPEMITVAVEYNKWNVQNYSRSLLMAL
jgi:excinuclease ABC subunit A